MNVPLAVWLGALVTLAVFSYLAKDNIVYRLVQNAALGVSLGFGIIIAWQQVLQPMWWAHVQAAFDGMFAWQRALQDPAWWQRVAGIFRGPGPTREAWWLLALIPGAMWYFQMSKRLFWVSTLVSGLFVGVAAGLGFKNQVLLVLPQITASLKPLNPFAFPGGATGDSVFQCASNLVFLIALFTTLLYFFFSVKTDNLLLRPAMRTGRLMIMITLGAMFGNTVMTRMAYLIERLQFLHESWLAPLLAGMLPWVG
jgi:hypothetical protein